MKSLTILNQEKIHSLAITLIGVVALASQTINGFGCSLDNSSCVANRYANSEDIFLPRPSNTGQTKSGNPSPSQILVNNIPQCHVIKGLEVTLNNLSFPIAPSLTVALLSPCGDCIILLNEVGELESEARFVDATLTFSDCKGTQLDCNETGTISGEQIVMPVDCAPGSYCFNGQLDTTFCSTLLSKTFGKPAAGCWQLFTCIKPSTNIATLDGSLESWKLRIVHGLRAKDGCFDVFTSNCCGPCIC